MFTGIIEKQGQVSRLAREQSSLNVVIETGWSDLAVGESVAVNGVCLTVAELGNGGQATFYVSPETLERTNLERLEAGKRANLERALKADARLSGHIVQGHVDGLATLQSARESSGGHELRFELPFELSQYCVEKGSVCLNGVSLTLNQVNGREVSIMIIPHTWKETNLSALRPGDPVNVEVDVLAKYMAKFVEQHVERLCQK